MKNEIRVLRPKTLEELDQTLLQSREAWTFVAGGTDLLVQKQIWQQSRQIIDLTTLSELHHSITKENNKLRIGAAVPYTQIIQNPHVQEHFPILVQACRLIGSIQIQNRGTIGGNIANASPAGDTLPVLAVLNAQILLGPKENGAFQRYQIGQLMTGPGQTVLQKNQYIAFIEIPIPQKEGQFWAFRKIGQRAAIAISKLSLAVLGWFESDGRIKEIRISTGSVTPVIKRHSKTEVLLKGQKLTETLIEQAAQQLKQEIAPISDIRSTATYRKEITANVLRDVLHQLMMDLK